MKSNIHSSDNCTAVLILFYLSRSLSACSRHSRVKDPELSDKNNQYLVGQGNGSRTHTHTLNLSCDLHLIHVKKIIFNASAAHSTLTFSFPTTLFVFLWQGSRFILTLSPMKTQMRQCENLPRKLMFPLSRLRRLSVLVSPSHTPFPLFTNV